MKVYFTIMLCKDKIVTKHFSYAQEIFKGSMKYMGYQNTLQYLSRNLKRMREQKSLTQQQLAERLHYAHGSTIANFEDPRQVDHNPKAATLADIANELDCGINVLLFGDIVEKEIDIRTRLLSELLYLQAISNEAARKACKLILNKCTADKIPVTIRIADPAWRTVLDYHQCCPSKSIDRLALNMLRDIDRLQYDHIIGKYYHDAKSSLLPIEQQFDLNQYIPYVTYASDDMEVEL